MEVALVGPALLATRNSPQTLPNGALRCHYGPVLYRILYRRSKNLFVLLHMLRKNTGAIPTGDIQTAHARWEDFKARMDAE